MLKVICDRCRKEIENPDAPDGGELKICVGHDWNSSWEEYGQLVFCGDCVEADATLEAIRDACQ